MIISLDEKINEKKNIDELKESLKCFNELRETLKQIDVFADDIIDSINDAISNKGNVNAVDLFVLIECKNRFTNEAIQIIKIFNELGIVELK